MTLITGVEAKRFAELAVRLVVDQATPGVRDLFQALAEERARRFVAHLNAANGGDRAKAEAEIRTLASSQSGEAVLMHVARECFLGTERISLAGMAVLLAEGRALDPADGATIAAAIEGLADVDAVAFLLLLSRPAARRSVSTRWRPGYAIDCSVARTPEWEVARHAVGVDEEALFSCITECVRRRIFLPDPSIGRYGNENDIAVRYFCTARRTATVFRLLHRALTIVDVSLVERCEIMTPDAIRKHWPVDEPRSDTSEPAG